MLSRLKREGYRQAVCSNSIRESLELMVRHSGVHDYFEFLVSNEDVIRPKPDPEIYTHAITRMGLTPAETLIEEDAPHGLEAARRAGAHICQVDGFTEVDYFRVRAAIDRAHGTGALPERRVA
jgi:beta-phosphoglucomutase-like phosphatase (HAD superfamily)